MNRTEGKKKLSLSQIKAKNEHILQRQKEQSHPTMYQIAIQRQQTLQTIADWNDQKIQRGSERKKKLKIDWHTGKNRFGKEVNTNEWKSNQGKKEQSNKESHRKWQIEWNDAKKIRLNEDMHCVK